MRPYKVKRKPVKKNNFVYEKTPIYKGQYESLHTKSFNWRTLKSKKLKNKFKKRA